MHIPSAAAAAVLTLAAVPAAALPLSFEAALAAASDAPSVAARRASLDAARSAALPARQLPDPKLEFGLQDYPVNGPNVGSFTRDNFTMQTVGVSQEFPSAAKRRARAGRAAADIGAAAVAESVEARAVRLATGVAWIDLYFAEQRLAALRRLDMSIDALVATVPARLASGNARAGQLLEPRVLKADVGDRRSALVAEIAKARAVLARWTGDPAADVAGPPPAWRVDAAALRARTDSLPTLRALDAATALAEADAGLARADKRSDWEVIGKYGRREPRYGDLVSIGVRVELPLFAKRRQDPLIAARGFDAERARLDRDAGSREATATLEADLADHTMHHDRDRRAREELVPLARETAALTRADYAAGKADLREALDGAVALSRAELDALDREAEVVRDGVRINLTYGDDR